MSAGCSRQSNRCWEHQGEWNGPGVAQPAAAGNDKAAGSPRASSCGGQRTEQGKGRGVRLLQSGSNSLKTWEVLASCFLEGVITKGEAQGPPSFALTLAS